MTLLTPRPGILDIKPYAGGESSIPGRAHAVKLSSNENPLGASPSAVAAYKAAADSLFIYPDGHSTVLRAAIGRRHGLDPARIVCGAGSDELLALYGRAYAGPGDEIIVSQHGFSVYPIITRAVGATLVVAPERELTTDVDAILAAVTPRTRIVFVANPNNPTGTYLPADEMRRLRFGLPDGVLLVVDAAYAEYVTRNDYEAGAALVDEFPGNTVMTRTFSKIYGLAALRIGWTYCDAEIAAVLDRIRGPFNVCTPAIDAGAAAMADLTFEEESRRHNEHWLGWLTAELRALGLTVPTSAANFLLVRFPQEEGRDVEAAVRALNAHGIIPRRMNSYGLPDSLRISIGLAEDNQTVVTALSELFRGSA